MDGATDLEEKCWAVKQKVFITGRDVTFRERMLLSVVTFSQVEGFLFC